MPAELGSTEESASGRFQIGVSAVTELAFSLFTIQRAERKAGHEPPPWYARLRDERPELRDAVLGFWAGSSYEEWGELVVLAWYAKALMAEDAETFFARFLEVADQGIEVPPLGSEPPEVRSIIRGRIEELGASVERREAYLRLLREVWAFLQPDWQGEALPVARAMVEDLRARAKSNASVASLIPGAHMARRERFQRVVEETERSGMVLVVPLCLPREGQFVFAMPGMLLIGLTPETERRAARRRESSERAAARFKVLSDTTRLTLLGRLLHEPSSITDLANYFELSQPTVSVHVKMLREAGLLEAQKSGAHTLYSARERAVRRFVEEGLTEAVQPWRPKAPEQGWAPAGWGPDRELIEPE